MALTGYLTLKGTTQGDMKGDCIQTGREDSILVYAFEHEIEIPTDTHTGLPTGQRIHKPFTIVKKLDTASPLIMKACATGEQISEWELKLFRINSSGNEEHYYSVSLESAVIVNAAYETPLTFLEDSKPYHNMEKISFSYSKLVHHYQDGGIITEDDWTVPSV